VDTPERVQALIGKELYFGEVLGKHSEIYGELKEDEVELLTDNPEAVNVVESYNLTTGYNPFDYYTCTHCGSILDLITNTCDCLEDDT